MSEESKVIQQKWTLGDKLGFVGGIVGILSIVISGLGWWEARQSRQVAEEAQKLSQKNYDRAAGKIGANISVQKFTPESENIPKRLKVNLAGMKDEIQFETLNDLRALNARLIIKNTGEEIVDIVRVECRTSLLAIKFPENPPIKEFGAIWPWQLQHLAIEDYSLSRKLLPNESARVPLTKVILRQILHSQEQANKERDHFGSFEIRCFARIVGGTAFDNSERNSIVYLRFGWKAKGFGEKDCKECLESDKAGVEILKD